MNKKISKTIRHPTENKGVKPTPSVPLTSLKERDNLLLKELSKNEKGRFNVKEYSRINSIPRSTIYDILNKLERFDLVIREKGFGISKITEKGKIYLDNINWGVGSLRRECRDNQNLSTHYHKFTLPIIDRKKFRIESLKQLKNRGIKENKLANLHQIIIKFEDANIVINPKEVRIHLFDILTGDVEDSDLNSLTRAIKYAEILANKGLETEGMMVEEGHWARVDSILADFIYNKVDKRYFLELENGSKFWIDCSGGSKPEDETNNKIIRERVDNFLNQVSNNDFDLNDINKIKESLGFITKLESSRLQDQIEENKLKRLQIKESKSKNFETKLNFITYIN